VLRGDSDEALSDGQIQVLTISGRFCKASTKLESLGRNRWVRFE
jgi:hypothetical protein